MSYGLLVWKRRPDSDLQSSVIYLLISDEVEIRDLEDIDIPAIERALDLRFPEWRLDDPLFGCEFRRAYVSFELFHSVAPVVVPKLTAALRTLGLTVFDPQEVDITAADQKAARKIKRATRDRELAELQKAELAELTFRATSGDSKAQLELGNKLACGNGVRKDAKQAAQWYRRGAEAGEVDAMFNFAACLQYGDGIKQDLPEAIRWYLLAADSDKMYAPFALGEIYLGFGPVARDNARAESYFRQALAHSHPDAAAALRLLEESEITLASKKKAWKFWNPRA